MDWNGILDLTKQLGGILVVVFYASIVLWTYKDAKRRLDDPILVATAVATSMLPVVGVFVYMLLRPPEYLADVRERELETIALQRQLGSQERCPKCRSHIERDYLSCPVCETKLRAECIGCERPLDPRWAMCPYCETPAPRSGPTPPGGGGRKREPIAGPSSRSSKVSRSSRDEAPVKRDSPKRDSPKRDAEADAIAVRAAAARMLATPPTSPATAAAAIAPRPVATPLSQPQGSTGGHVQAPTATMPVLGDAAPMHVEPLKPGTPAH